MITILTYFQFRQHKNANIVNFVFLEKNSIDPKFDLFVIWHIQKYTVQRHQWGTVARLYA